MDIRKLQRAIVDGLEDVKGQNIVVFNTEHLSPLFERVIIASGTSNRQTKALASGVREAVKSRGFPVMRTEGEDNGEWIIVDCGAAVVHLMQPSIREYYHLEEIWGEKPVRMKIAEGPVRLVKAGDGDRDRDRAAAPRRAAKPARAADAAAGAAGKRAGTARLAEQALAPRSVRSAAAGKSPSTTSALAPTQRMSAGKSTAPPAPRKPAGKSAAPSVARKPVGKSVATSASRATVTRTVGVKGGGLPPAESVASGSTAPRKRAAAPSARKRAPRV